MDSNSKIFVAGHKGLVGSAIVRNLKEKGFTNILTADRNQIDLTKCSQLPKYPKGLSIYFHLFYLVSY